MDSFLVQFTVTYVREPHHMCFHGNLATFFRTAEAVIRMCSVKKGVLRNFTKFAGKHPCQSQAQVLSCEFCEISKNTFFYRIPLVTASRTATLLEHK